MTAVPSEILTIPHGVCFDDVHEIVNALSAALDAKHPYTSGHSERVAELSSLIAREAGLDAQERLFVHVAAHLHDIGKIGVPDFILAKDSALTDAEFETIKQHPVIGCDLLSKVSALRPFAAAVRHHHERFDGRGYPDGLYGLDIPLTARIICLADSYDAMTSARAYRARISPARAIDEIKRCAGTQFDPGLVDVFLQIKISQN